MYRAENYNLKFGIFFEIRFCFFFRMFVIYHVDLLIFDNLEVDSSIFRKKIRVIVFAQRLKNDNS